MKNLLIISAITVALFSCNSQAETAKAIEEARKATIDSMNTANAIAIVKQRTIDSMNRIKARHREDVAQAPSQAPNQAPAEDNTPVAKKKKKWSHTAKAAVVGAGAGAITGAIVNKDRVKGAAIGTIIGAGAGAGIGAIVDHKEKKKKAQ